MFSNFEPNFIEKFFRESGFSIFGQNWNDTNENRFFLKRYNIFFPEFWLFIVHTYMVQISLQNSDGKVVFLGGSMKPLGHQREWKYLGHLSVNMKNAMYSNEYKH